MTRATALSLHELAFLCGGSRRAVLTGVLALCQSGQLELNGTRVYRLDDGWTELEPVERAVLDVVPVAGVQLSSLIAAVERSDAVRATRGRLAALGLALRWPLTGLTAAGRRVRREAAVMPAEGLRRIALLGPDAIPDAELRRAFTSAPTSTPARVQPDAVDTLVVRMRLSPYSTSRPA
ncbi:TIGR04222 domain-containing membrane protein [Kribbella sp. NPDC056861]|uniref:TIGR04222 domain-containing membrane protein n=1 Tax=Kribbella sp. NPDC056861 TaxID=3154857 RepID=UPI003421B004